MRSWTLAFLFVVVGCGGSVAGGEDTAAGGSAGTTSHGGSSGSTSQGGHAGTPAGQGGTTGVGGVSGAGGSPIEPGPFTGVWKGYVENYKFDDGTDTVTMTLYSVQSQVAGVIRFGEKALYAPATDPNTGYPPGATHTDYQIWSALGPLTGFEFSLVNGSFDGSRLQFDIETRQVWSSWCPMQTAYQLQGGSYGCLPATGGYFGTKNECWYSDLSGTQVSCDCGKLELCMGLGYCECDPTGCVYAHGNTNHFDMQLASNKADGSATLNELHNVHLTHQ